MNKKYHTQVYPNQSLKVERYFFTHHKRSNLYLLFLLLFFTISVSYIHAEGSGNWKGSATVSRLSSLYVPGNTAGNTGYDTRGSMMRPSATTNYDTNHRFYVYVKAGETVYFSFRSSTSSNFTWYYDNSSTGYNTFFPSGLSGSGQTAVTTANSNLQGRTSTNTSLTQPQAFAGPSALTSGGYPTTGTASATNTNAGGQFTNNTGQDRAFWVEMASPGNNGWEITDWDVTVASGTTKRPGRVYCRYWSIYSGLPSTAGQTNTTSFHDDFGFYVPVDNTYSAQTDDYYIKYVNFGKSNAGYVVFFANDSGPLNEKLANGDPNIEENRKSIKGTSNRYQYPLFVAEPDESIWKTSRGPVASTDVRFGRKADATGGEAYFIVYVDTPGILDILVDIDGSGSYSAGDVRLFRYFNDAGTYDVYWDGKDDNGNIVPAGTVIKLFTSANFFPVHFPVYDMEQSLGITMKNIRPVDMNKATVKLYWDHSKVYTGGPGNRNTNWFTVPANQSGTFANNNVQSPAINTTGADSPANIWWANGNNGIGNENTFNVYAGSWMETMELNFTFNWDKSDIEVIKTVSNSTPAIGSEVTFTIKVANKGMMYSQNIMVSDPLPPGYEYISHTASMGSTVTPSPIGSNDPEVWTEKQTVYDPIIGMWDVYDIPYDALDLSKNERTLTIKARVLKAGLYNNTAEGYPETIESDPDLSNNISTVMVNPTNTTNAVNDINVTQENKSISGNVLTNDFDLEGHIQTVTSTGSFTTDNGGTIVINANGTYTYTPANDFIGTDSFTYTVCDDVPAPLKACATATITINVIPERDPSINNNVVANDDTGVTEQDKPVSGNLLTNDFDPDGDNLIINTTPTTPPSHGTVTISSDGTYIYTPESGFKGVDTFVYEVCDDGDPATCDRATVTITVLPKSDKTNHTYANDDAYYSEVNKTVNGNVLLNDFDPEGDNQIVNTTPVNAPAHGSLVLNIDGTFIYTPNNGFTGTDSFVYEVCDNGTPVACDKATVYIHVNPEPVSPNTTYAIDDINITYKNTSVGGNVLTNDFDPEGNSQTVTNNGSITTTKGGTVILNADGSYLYTPKNDFVGEDSFTYTVCDNGVPQACDQATVTIKVIQKADPTINNNIIANDDEAVTRKNRSVSGNVLTNDFDPDGDNMTVNTTLITSPNNGSVTIAEDGTYTYTPNTDFVGQDSFVYEVCDDGDPVTCDQATVTITVILDQSGQVNYTFARDDVFYIDGKKTLNGNVLDNDFDPDGNQQIVNTTPVSSTSNGTLTLNANGTFSYVANDGFKGTDSFIYEICDTGTPQACDRATVYIVVNIRNYWHGTVDTDWAKENNWTANYVPVSGENIEFATASNNGSSGSGNGAGAAVNDLYLDKDRIIGDLINNSDMNLVVTTQNQLTINGSVNDTNSDKGTIIVKTSPDEATGTLIFTNPATNLAVNATVEFYNKAYECTTCGYYKRQWQYFGIPVNSSAFPSTGVETVNQWVEPYSGDKWRPAPYSPDTQLKAFKGYEMTNSATSLPDKIYNFTGTLNVGDAIVPLTKTSNVNYSGMNLIGNSYTAAIPISTDAITFGTGLLEEETVYLFNTGTRDQWRKLNGSTATGISGGQYQAVPFSLAGQATLPDRILSMHTFMLNAKTSGSITLKYAKLGKNELINQSAWRSLKSSNSEAYPHIIMDVIGDSSADRVWLFENPATTNGFDNGWDGYKLLENGLTQVYVSGTNKEKFQIATVPQIAGTAFDVKTSINENYTLNLSVTPDIENRKLYLRDLTTGHIYPIVNNGEYAINGKSSLDKNRFDIVSSNSVVTDDDEGSALINITVNNNVIVVTNMSEVDCLAIVYDLNGKKIFSKNVKKYSSESFTDGYFIQNSVYIVKVADNKQTVKKTSRIFMK